MKIAKIIIKGFQQFENFSLDLENPDTGRPPDKVCFIGPNGTGKSTLLRLITSLLQQLRAGGAAPDSLANGPFFAVRIQTATHSFIACAKPPNSQLVYYKSDVENTKEWHQFVTDPNQNTVPPNFCLQHYIASPPVPPLDRAGDLVIHAPADGSMLLQQDPPNTTLNNALTLFKNVPAFQVVSVETATAFWDLLIYHTKKLESDYLQHLKNPENRKKTVEEVEEEFQRTHPKILPEIGDLWNHILAKAGLEFDTESAQIPVQLNENLVVHVKTKISGHRLRYNELSSGIRNYIFKLGHIRALYFQRKIERGFLLLDEPENSLFPDLLYGLIDEYLSIVDNTQLFVATQNPIIAAQFEPHGRIHLGFDDRAFVTASHGVSPIGDDPNDLLIKDFHLPTVYQKEGMQEWNRFLELRRLIDETSDASEKQRLLDEYLAIGNEYNFDPDEIS